MAIKTPSPLLTELEQYVQTLADTPYEALLSTAYKDGYRNKLVQKSAEIGGNGAVLVTFDVMVGKDGTPLEHYDTVSVAIEPGQTQVSLAARVRAVTPLIFMFFGRLPVAPAATPTEPERTIDTSHVNGDDDIILDDAPAAPEAEDRDFPEAEPFIPPRREPEPRLNLIAKREADGVPIFIDLYAMDGELAGIDGLEIAKVLVEDMETFIKRAESAEQVLAIFSKNPDVIPFLGDFGTPELGKQLNATAARKSAQLSTPSVTVATAKAQPKRRVPVGARG